MNNLSLLKSSNGVQVVDLDSRLFSKRIIFIDDEEITPNLVNNVFKNIMVLKWESETKPITILINSAGGNIQAGMQLYDLLQTCKTPIRIVAIGQASSMAAVLLAAGKHGRYVFENTSVMIHQPLLGNAVSGNTTSIKEISDHLIETKEKMNRLLAKHTNKTVEEIDKATSYDHYFTAQEAVEFGLCDKIIGFEELFE